MALLNKLFFPTANVTSITPTPAVASSTVAASTTSVHTAAAALSNSNSWTTSTAAGANKRHSSSHQSVHSKNYLSQFPFDGRQVRVLLYRECDSRGRRLLFDSNALQKVPLKEANGNLIKTNEKQSNSSTTTTSSSASGAHLNGNCIKENSTTTNNSSAKQQQQHYQQKKQQFNNNNKGHSNGFIEFNEDYGYKHNRPRSADITTIGEMVFGALAMSFRGTAFKVHWLQAPSRILCSQMFLSPVNYGHGQSPHSTISTQSLATPRHSITSEYGSVDGLSMNSFSMPFSVHVDRHMSLTPSEPPSVSCSGQSSTNPLDVPDHQSLSSSCAGSGPRYSSTYSTGTDSGYSAMSRMGGGGDQWSSSSNSYQYSTRSSLGSVNSDRSESMRKLSMDSSCFVTSSPYSEEFASDGSLQRRITRNLHTSFENENSVSDLIGFISDNRAGGGGGAAAGGSEGTVGMARRASYASTHESRSNPEIGRRRDAAAIKQSTRRAKLGLAVCISMSESFEEEMELFCSEHIALLESMLSRLRACTERAYINHKDFLQIMFHAWQETQQWINDLFTAPRIKCPVWLSITTSGSKYSKSVAERFIKELCWLLSLADTKDTNFFISTMLTAILTHHLGWVSTVSAFAASSALSRSQTAAAAIEQRAKLLEVSQKHPYNALWAQMGDLYGAIGMPPKLTRTVIYGTEKLSVERLLNTLTYFIRCGEVRRAAKREDFNKELLKTIVQKNQNETLKKSTTALNKNSAAAASEGVGGLRNLLTRSGGGGMTRTQTCKQNLNTIEDCGELLHGSNSSSEDEYAERELVTLKKNEIPNVLAYRDSRFVQQELRIGNYLMDTGILKSSMQQQTKLVPTDKIRLTITTPDNVEMPVESTSASVVSDDGAMEAIEIETSADQTTTTNAGKKHFFWNMVPPVIKEGLSWSDLEKLQQGVKLVNRKLQQRSGSFSQASQQQMPPAAPPRLDKRQSHLSLSDLITQNSMGKGDRMTWGVEPIKETVSIEEQMHFDFCQKLIDREHMICRDKSSNSDVVFVLGDNEPLVNLKKSNEDLVATTAEDVTAASLCPLHQRTHGAHQRQPYAGVKFNFETYPQIATNYMKSKNLVMPSSYDFALDKNNKQQSQQQQTQQQQLFVEKFPDVTRASTSIEAQSAANNYLGCVVCNCLLNSYQTPSNATELEFETDEEHYHNNNNTAKRGLPAVSSASSVNTLKSSTHGQLQTGDEVDVQDDEVQSTTPSTQKQVADINVVVSPTLTAKRTGTFNGNSKKLQSQRVSTSTVAAKCAAVNEAVHLLKLPVPGIKELPQDDDVEGDMKLRAGFIPSLFLSVSDHYISDMVLQGTFASPKNWEMNLREDLALAAHSASLISLPAENLAIVADMEKWDVRLISSQTQCFPYAGGQSAPVGMSQLVSSMLETVQAMNSSGISAYECLSFLESKLQEIYLQSETLAAFLLDTDFCPLSAVTTALNLSENDVPLLLSVASIHTPQISKKCGISFR